jgi:lysozyme family protein
VKPDATAADVRAMRLDQAKAIYKTRYWDAMRCDGLPAG